MNRRQKSHETGGARRSRFQMRGSNAHRASSERAERGVSINLGEKNLHRRPVGALRGSRGERKNQGGSTQTSGDTDLEATKRFLG